LGKSTEFENRLFRDYVKGGKFAKSESNFKQERMKDYATNYPIAFRILSLRKLTPGKDCAQPSRKKELDFHVSGIQGEMLSFHKLIQDLHKIKINSYIDRD